MTLKPKEPKLPQAALVALLPKAFLPTHGQHPAYIHQTFDMTTRVPVKSILKTQTTQPADNQDQEKADRDAHNYALALSHAHRIQDQKDWDARILLAIEVLLDYPRQPDFTAEEAETFTKLVQPFQPSDLDALVEERVADGKCGYVLCAKQPRRITMGKDAEWRVGKGGQDFCSTKCAKKSAYVKTQLSELPASERDGVHPRIVLDEASLHISPPLHQSVAHAAVAKHLDQEELAQERNDDTRSFRPKQVMTDRIVEKAATTYKPLSGLSAAAVSSTAIEGYEPTGRVKFAKGGVEEESEEEEEGGVGGDDGHDDEDG